MSKSRGTGIDAVEAMNKWGADVLRLWAASVEFVDDVRFGPNVVEQVGRVYRNIRNRVRFMLSNLDDLGAADVVPRERMDPLDKLACAITDTFVADVKALYARYAIHDAYLRIVEFESAMSSFYFDALKDPLYSLGANSSRRRSAQSALLYALKRMLTTIAPMLSFTAEEAWQEIPAVLRAGEPSVFDSAFGDLPAASERERELWETLRALRAQVAGSEIRDFEARVELRVPAKLRASLEALGDNLREALVVSHLELRESPGEELELRVLPAHGEKCKRCWKFRELGTDREHPSICADCAAVVRAL